MRIVCAEVCVMVFGGWALGVGIVVIVVVVVVGRGRCPPGNWHTWRPLGRRRPARGDRSIWAGTGGNKKSQGCARPVSRLLALLRSGVGVGGAAPSSSGAAFNLRRDTCAERCERPALPSPEKKRSASRTPIFLKLNRVRPAQSNLSLRNWQILTHRCGV